MVHALHLLLDTQITLWWLGDTPELPNAMIHEYAVNVLPAPA